MAKLITEATLVSMLKDFRGAQFVSIVTETEPKMNQKHRVTKEPNPYLGHVKRAARRSGMLGADYENAVNNRRDVEGHPDEFRAEALWNGAGEHVEGSKALVRHKSSGKFYMVFYPRNDAEGTVQVAESMWLCDGKEIDVELLKPYLPPVKEGAPKQETDRPVPWRVIGVEGIVQLTMDGETYIVTH